MFEYSCIFSPVDFSRASRAAVELAQTLAQRHKARLELLHVIESPLRYMRPILFPYAALGDDEVRLQDEIRAGAREALAEHLRLPEEERGQQPALEVLFAQEGEAAEACITARMSASEAELVVMGAFGESGSNPGVLGSACLRVLNSATRPTLVIRDVGKVRLERVSVALDLGPHSAQVLRQAVGMALLLEAPLEVLVVVPTVESFDVDGILGGMTKLDKRALRRQAQRSVDKRLAQLMEDMEVPFPWREKLAAMERRHTLLWGDPAAELAQHCAEADHHLLVLGTQGDRRAALARQVGRTASAVAANVSSHLMFVP